MKVIEDSWQKFWRQNLDLPIPHQAPLRKAFFAGAVCLMNLITQIAEIHADVDDLGNNPRLNALLAELKEFAETLEKP